MIYDAHSMSFFVMKTQRHSVVILLGHRTIRWKNRDWNQVIEKSKSGSVNGSPWVHVGL